MKTTINNKLGVITVALLLSGLVPSTMMAQDKVEASVGADLVSGYIWRGQNLGGVSVPGFGCRILQLPVFYMRGGLEVLSKELRCSNFVQAIQLKRNIFVFKI